MVARFALRLLEGAALVFAVVEGISATTSQSVIEMAITGMAALVAAQLHGLAATQAVNRRFDAAISSVRPAPPSNDPGGM